MPKLSEHLGDGAYITFDGYGYWITANHHDPDKATDRVFLDGPYAKERLLEFFSRVEALKQESDA